MPPINKRKPIVWTDIANRVHKEGINLPRVGKAIIKLAPLLGLNRKEVKKAVKDLLGV